ncbi:MAG: aspartyl protease family protein [Dehalococcoidia bacterium]|nr:aspartyl protease family protein [Dehalococcoidia bacterium]
MGTFSTEIAIGGLDRERWATVDALVDTGASIVSAPASLLRGLGVEPAWKQGFEFADGETREMDVGHAWVRVGGREITTQVLFNEEGSAALLGALALEGAFLGVNPVRKRLMPVGGWLARVLKEQERGTLTARRR